MDSYEEKYNRLHDMMKGYAQQNVAVAFSGGVDSSLLLKMAVAAPQTRHRPPRCCRS